MRIDKNNPHNRYDNFWDWLFSDVNYIWTLALAVGYLYYLMTTCEV